MRRLRLLVLVTGLVHAGTVEAQERRGGQDPGAGSHEAGEAPDRSEAGPVHRLQLAAGVPDLGRWGTGTMLMAIRGGHRFLTLSPTGGVMVGTEGQFFVFGGLFRDLPWRSVIFTPVVTMGGYGRGEGRELGSVLEFRSGLETSWQFGNGSRLGLQFGHISNAGFGWRNPGVEYLLMTFALPF